MTDGRTGVAREGCYAAALRDCDGPLEREHFMSESVMKQFVGPDGAAEIHGPAWASGRRFRPSSVGAKVLCARHNRGLSRLDDAAKRFAAKCKELSQEIQRGDEGQAIRAEVDGWDLERWVLKALIGLMASGDGGPKYQPPRHLLAILYEQEAFAPPEGLYVPVTSNGIAAFPGPGLNVVRGRNGEVLQLLIRVSCLVFALHLGPQVVSPSAGIRQPGRLLLNHGRVQSRIDLVWEDGGDHGTIEQQAWTGPSELHRGDPPH